MLCNKRFIKNLQPACNFIKKKTLAHVFSCEFLRNSKNTFCYRTPPVAASVCCRRTPPVAASVRCRRKVAAVKIEKLRAFIIKYYEIGKTYSVLLYSVNLSYFYFLSMIFSHQFSVNQKMHIADALNGTVFYGCLNY